MKTFLPQSRVPGAKPDMTDDLAFPRHRKDPKGRPLWIRPKPTRYVEHNGVHRNKRTGKTYRGPTQVPIYRAVAASDMRYYKAQARRAQRKQGIITDKPEFTGTSRMIQVQKFNKLQEVGIDA